MLLLLTQILNLPIDTIRYDSGFEAPFAHSHCLLCILNLLLVVSLA